MQNFHLDFVKILDAHQDYVCARISECHNIPKEELMALFNTDARVTVKQTPMRSAHERKKKACKCVYIFMKGCKKGHECGVKVPDGNNYCAKHSGKERKQKDVPVDDPAEKQTRQSMLDYINKAAQNQGSVSESEPESDAGSDVGSESDTESVCDSVSDVVSNQSSVSEEYQITKNKYGNFMDVETGFVFSTDSVVCGKQNMETGDIEDLDEDETILVESCGWTYVQA